MIPYKWPVTTEIPRNPVVRREIVKAMQELADDGDELLRQRRAEIASIRQCLAELARDLAALRSGTPSLISSALGKYGYNPEEPRVPKHRTGGGRWTNNGTQFAASGANDAASILRPRGGHHFVPRAVYKDLPLKPETKKVFDDSRTGPLKGGRHGWDAEHDAYNQAAADAFKKFLARNGIEPQDMTPEQALRFIFEVIGSNDPRIHDLNLRLYRREMLHYILHHMFLNDPLEGPLEIEGGSDD